MEDFKKVAADLQENVMKLTAINNTLLQKVRNQAPDQVDDILRDQKSIVTAIKNRDLETINKLQKKYADNSN